jgi:hypothetical protein
MAGGKKSVIVHTGSTGGVGGGLSSSSSVEYSSKIPSLKCRILRGTFFFFIATPGISSSGTEVNFSFSWSPCP